MNENIFTFITFKGRAAAAFSSEGLTILTFCKTEGLLTDLFLAPPPSPVWPSHVSRMEPLGLTSPSGFGSLLFCNRCHPPLKCRSHLSLCIDWSGLQTFVCLLCHGVWVAGTLSRQKISIERNKLQFEKQANAFHWSVNQNGLETVLDVYYWSCLYPVHPRAAPQAGASELEVISQQVEEDNQAGAPIQLVSFTYRDLPLAALDVSLAGSQLISNPDEEDNRDGWELLQTHTHARSHAHMYTPNNVATYSHTHKLVLPVFEMWLITSHWKKLITLNRHNEYNKM